MTTIQARIPNCEVAKQKPAGAAQSWSREDTQECSDKVLFAHLSRAIGQRQFHKSPPIAVDSKAITIVFTTEGLRRAGIINRVNHKLVNDPT